MTQPAHASLGASKAHRWLACPGSVRMEEPFPDVPSEYAMEGTVAHEVAERRLLGEVVEIGAKVEVGDREGGSVEFEVTEEMSDAIDVYVDFVNDMLRSSGEGAQMYVEQRFDLAPLQPPAPMFGTSDCVIWNPVGRHLHVIDYKHGQGVAVEAEKNPQLMYYALGAVVSLGVKPTTVTVTVVQPRAQHAAGPIRSYGFPWDELADFHTRLMAGANRTLDPNAPLVVGDHCRFCKAQAVCPAQRSHAIEIAQVEFDTVAPEKVELPAPETLDTEQIVKALNAADVIEGWFRAIREHVQFMLETGQSVPGWKLVDKRATRRWADEQTAESWLSEQLGEEAYESKLVSPAQAERKLKRVSKEAAKAMDQFVIRRSSGTTLVPESDPRPAAVAGVDEFAALPPGPQNLK